MTLPFSFSIDTNRGGAIFETIPVEIGNWHGKEMPVDERTYEILETRNVLSRTYENREGGRIHLLVVASYKDRRVAHPPEVCYLSSNYTLLNSREGELLWKGGRIPLKEFIAQDKKNPAHQEKVLYVYKVGRRFTTNYFAQQLQFTWDRLTRNESQILLIRLAGSDKSDFKQLLSELLPHLS